MVTFAIRPWAILARVLRTFIYWATMAKCTVPLLRASGLNLIAEQFLQVTWSALCFAHALASLRFWGIPLWGIPLYANSRMAELWSFQVSRQYVPLRCIIAIVKCACGGSRCEMCHQFPLIDFLITLHNVGPLPLLGVLLKRLKYYLRTMIRTTLRNPAKKNKPT